MTFISCFVRTPDQRQPLTPVPGLSLLTFPGGEPHAKLDHPESVRGKQFLLDARIGSFATLGSVLVLHDMLVRLGAARVDLFCPYLPGARQDRDAPLTAALYARIINGAGFARVVAVDAHSPVMPALLDRLTVISPDVLVDPRMLEGSVVLVCPDAGATKRTEAVAEKYQLDVIYARKHRDKHTGGLTGFSCEPVPSGACALIIDDICDGGGTFLGLAQVMGVARDQLRLWSTHGIYSQGLGELTKTFSRIGCTDSFPSDHVPEVRVSLLEHPAVRSILNEP